MIPTRQLSPAMTIILSFSVFGAALSSSSYPVRAGDWPQVLGPQRNSQAVNETPLGTDWKTTKPKELWRVPAQSGYSGAAIVDGTAFLFDRDASDERLRAVKLATGEQIWKAAWSATYRSSMDPDSGPRAVPTVAQGRVVCYGAAGDLVCVNASSGKLLWQRHLRKEYAAEDGYFGAGSSPLITDGVIIANIGGKKAGVVGVSLESGETLWQATTYDASYASPIALEVEGKPAALVVTRLHTILLDVKTGEVMSDVTFGSRGPTVNAATPLRLGDNYILLTASYNIGAYLFKLDGSQLDLQWNQADLLASQYNSPLLMGDIVVGVHGREDAPDVELRGIYSCLPNLMWQHPLTGPAHLIGVGDHLLVVALDGEVSLGTVSAAGFKTEGAFSIASPSRVGKQLYRSLPALSNHVLLVRSTRDASGGEFIAYQLP